MARRPEAAPDLAVRSWRPGGHVRARVALVHGYAEHGGRYDRVARRLAARGFAVHALDLPGHGRSPGVRGDLADGGRLAGIVRAWASELAPPRFLFGHSVGGVLATLAAADLDGLHGLVLSSPYVQNAVPVPGGLVRIVRWLARWTPHLPVRRLDPESLSRIAAEVRAYREDPLVYTGRVRARAGATMLALGAAALAAAPRVRAPALLVHGADDRIADPAGARALAERLGSPEVRLEIYRGGYHELLNDLARERVAADIEAWLEARA